VGVALLDSSAFVGYLDVGDGLHADASDAVESLLRRGSSLAISAVTWAEILNGVYQDHHDEEVVRDFVRDFGVAIITVDVDVAETAAALQAGYARTGRRGDKPKLRTPDALILATATLYSDIDTVVGGDSKWRNVPDVTAGIVLLRESG
jgi:predicted nucleic acid-binding protein